VQTDYQLIDTTLFIAANVVNLMVIGIMLSRPFGLGRLEKVLGLVSVSCALPLAAGAAFNAAAGRPWWAVLLPVLLAAFLVLELVLDYILKMPFRQTRLLGPYLLAFYVGVNAMVGYCFQVNNVYGFVTLGTYLLGLLATWYSYSQVRHGSASA